MRHTSPGWMGGGYIDDVIYVHTLRMRGVLTTKVSVTLNSLLGPRMLVFGRLTNLAEVG